MNHLPASVRRRPAGVPASPSSVPRSPTSAATSLPSRHPWRRALRVLASVVIAGVAPLACGGDSGTGPPDGGSASVSVSPASATLEALGATRDFSGSGQDGDGQSLSEGDLSWSSTNSSVASVDGSGVATARGNGSTRIIASFSGSGGPAADTADLTVDQTASSVTVTPDSVEVAASGDTAHFSASAQDANGNAVGAASFDWTSTDGSVATVDGSGVATAQASGSAMIVATASSGVADSADFVVGGDGGGGGSGDPQIDAVSPDTLDEGATATIDGQDFGSTASENEVLVDGVQATVTSASATQLEISVPQFDCRPVRGVDVQVVVNGTSSNTVGSAVRPDEAPVSLAAGERTVIRTPGDDFCLQFEPTSSSDEEYLVGVQSASGTPGATSVVFSSETGAGGTGSSVAAAFAAPTPDRRVPGGPAGGAADLLERPDRWTEHYRAEARLRSWEADRLPSLRDDLAAPGGGPPAAFSHGPSVPDSVAEGDTVSIRVPDAAASDACATFTEIEGIVRKIGTHGIWIEDVANPSSGYSSSDWTDLSDTFDGLVHPTDTDNFGDPTDMDSNGHVVMVVTKEVNEVGGLLGFVFGGDLLARSSCSSSDEGELTYLLAPDPNGVHGTTWTVEELKEDNPRLVAHEFAHMIQFGVRLTCSQCNFMPAFMAEGQAVVAEELNGHAETGRSPGNDYGGTVAWSDSPRPWYDNRFIDMARYYGWGGSGVHHDDAPEDCSWLSRTWAGVCTGGRGVYGVPSSIIRWMADHFGPGHPGGEVGFHRDMTANTETGFSNWEDLTGLTIKEILAYWAPMLWVDGRISVSDGQLTLPSWDLKDVFDAVVTEARLQPKTRGFTDFSDSFGVNAGSSRYYLIGASSRPHVAVKARAPGGGSLGSHMQMWVVRTK